VSNRLTAGERAYRRLLRLLPRAFRDRFEADLLQLFRDKQRVAAARGFVATLVCWLRLLIDLAISAAAEHRRQVSRRESGTLLQGLGQDVRFAARGMRRRPGLSVVVVITLALGIGANTAIFSLVHTVLLRPSPYYEPDRLVGIREEETLRGQTWPVRPANFFDWKARSTSFEDVAWSRDGIFNLTGNGEPESLTGYRFSANMFDVLGVRPAIGRTFLLEEDRPGAPGVVILSHALWVRRFAGDPGVLGRSLTLNGRDHVVVGVMPPTFRHPQRTELWVPIAVSETLKANRSNAVLRPVARLKPGVSRDAAQRELASLYDTLARAHPDTNNGLTGRVVPFGGSGDAKPMLLTLFAGVGFVLLIACANVANLLLADASTRRRELAVRTALGASRFRVIRQMLTECVLLSLTAGVLGALVTWWTSGALPQLFPANIANLNLPLVDRVDVGAPVFFFAFALSVVTGLVFGLLPALNTARSDLQGALKDGDRSGSASYRTHGILVVAEVALSIVLLAGALLMVQSFVRLHRQQFGFAADRVLTARVLLPRYRYADDAKVTAFARGLVSRLQQIPGVEQVGLTNYLPLSGWSAGAVFTIEGQPEPAPGTEPAANYLVASADYFGSMGIRVLDGRTFTSHDDQDGARVAIVNQTLAARYWPGDTAVGKRILMGPAEHRQSIEIVGVVADVRSAGLEERIEPELYLPWWQAPDSVIGVALRTTLDPAALGTQVRAAVWSIDRDQPVTYVLPMSDLAAESLAFRRVAMMLAAGFGLLAVALAAIGIYGVLSYSVARRSREIGVRVALGATGGEVARLVIRQAMTLTSMGIAAGLAAALVLMRSLASLLYETRPGEPLTYVLAVAALLAVALIAAWIPARRATSVDPIVALRAE
jgi:putative ABC transport system permease protein